VLIRNKLRRTVFSLAAVVGTVLAVGAAPAMGAVHWSDTTHGMKIAGTLTVYKNGTEARTCTIAPETAASESSHFEGTLFEVTGPFVEYIRLTCTNGKYLEMIFQGNGEAAAGGGYQVSFYGYTSGYTLASPWTVGPWLQGVEGSTPVLKYINGSGATPSKLRFTSTHLGYIYGGYKLTATGDLTVTTSTGGLLTLQP
jgi:hypothetical protein